MITGVVKKDLRGVHPARQTMNVRARQRTRNAMGRIEPAGTENNKRRSLDIPGHYISGHFQTSSRLCTRIMEKYGALPSPTSPIGMIRCSPIVARSM